MQSGGLVAIPTETVYGLAADALNPAAVARIFAAKQRPEFDPLIVHVAEREQLAPLVRQVPSLAERLMQRFWPGPLTVVLEKTALVPDLVTSGLPSVAVRMPAHAVTRELLRECGCPLAAPSANLFGRTSPTTTAHVQEQLDGRIDYILEGGPCRVGVESTIVRIVKETIEILRPGGITAEELAELAPVRHHPGEADSSELLVPGQLPEHYAPRTPLLVCDRAELSEQLQACVGRKIGLMILQQSDLTETERAFSDATVIELASESAVAELLAEQQQTAAVSDPLESSRSRSASFRNAISPIEEARFSLAAARFFAALHELDAAGLECLIAVRLPQRGLGCAINDRLQRAAHR